LGHAPWHGPAARGGKSAPFVKNNLFRTVALSIIPRGQAPVRPDNAVCFPRTFCLSLAAWRPTPGPSSSQIWKNP
jgi:hypothetical protein